MSFQHSCWNFADVTDDDTSSIPAGVMPIKQAGGDGRHLKF